jgi:hypothetical protein
MHIFTKSSLAVFVVLLMSGCASATGTGNIMTKFERFIDRIISNPPSSAEAFQNTTQIKLNPVSANASFQTYQAASIDKDTAPNVTIELRTPISAQATAGALLIIQVSDECIGRQALEARYGKLDLIQMPNGKSMDEETVFSKKMGWGLLSFGFPENNKECVKTVTLNFDRR